MLKWWQEFSARPFVAHILRAIERFNVRGGAQLAAAITYFSVLSLVPILMLAFSGLGLTLTVLRPAALGEIEAWIRDLLPANADGTADLAGSMYEVVLNALTNWASILGFGLVIVIWVGSGWVGNLKRSVRLLMRNDVDDPGKQLVLPLDVLANFAGLVGMLVGVAATFAAATVAGSLGSTIGHWLGFEDTPIWTWLLRLLSLVVAFAAGAGLFRMLFGWFSPHPVPSHLAWVGAAIGSAGLLVLQGLTGYLIGMFSNNLSAAVFGSTIVLMLFLNLFATLLLFIAAWLATADAPAEVAAEAPEGLPGPTEPVEARPGELYVSAGVARRSLGIGLGTGYTVGAATGLGLGAALTALLGALFGRRK